MTKNPYLLRCYGRREGNHFIGVCVDLDIVVQASSIEKIQEEMTKALEAYFSSLDQKNLRDLFPRAVPYHVLIDYYRVYFIVRYFNFANSFKSNFNVFFEQLIPKNFSVSPCA